MIFDPTQHDVRRFFCDAWRRHGAGEPLTPLQAMALDAILAHPEYHDDVASIERALAAQYPPESGRTNPFLHLSMHLAIAEQLSIDQPPGIRAARDALVARLGDEHAAAHRIMDCLGEAMWNAQRAGTTPDGAAYLDCVRRQAGRRVADF